ncbi:MAG: hypothetical protein KA796_09320 [Chryseobacterium sp.]|nr:hypothetical protein [Chryseobacterium sp.]MBP7500046.1 hypothetical protein [Chryseobacterium sp.]
MKKISTVLAITFVSFNFISCRQDSIDADFDSAIQQRPVTSNKVADSISSDSVKTNKLASRPGGDPEKDPPRDTTNW